jgi:hypothetical protein
MGYRVGLKDCNDHGLDRWWSPEKPNLYDIEFALLVDGVEIDRVQSYFGMRKIETVDGKICLNNRPYFMKMVLDQGYFPQGILTPPSDEAIRADVELTKAMGFNGSRKHQKIEDPRFLYWCDKLGLLVCLIAVIHPLLQSPIVQGYCYTQLTDVEQEINGLLTYDRKPKVPLEVIKQINEGKVPKE